MKRVNQAALETGRSSHEKEIRIVSLSKSIGNNAISKENHRKCLLET